MDEKMKKDIESCMEALRAGRKRGYASTAREAAAFASGYLHGYPELAELLELILTQS